MRTNFEGIEPSIKQLDTALSLFKSEEGKPSVLENINIMEE
jgi:hypothetical protein